MLERQDSACIDFNDKSLNIGGRKEPADDARHRKIINFAVEIFFTLTILKKNLQNT